MTRRRLITTGLVALGLAAVAAGYTAYRLELRPVERVGGGTTKPFEVRSGESVPKVATNLKAAGFIRNRDAFITYVNLHGLRARLQAGTYSLSPTLSSGQIANIIAGGQAISKNLVVPEGFRISQIATAVAALGISQADFTKALTAPHSQTFLSTKPANVDLEGYLFPDSYEVSSTTTAVTLVNAMLDNFGRRVGSEYVQALAAQGLTLHQGLTLASMVEREVSISADRPVVAQIFLKRLKIGMVLGSDVTTHYAADLLGVPFDININSPYNTRRFGGLPPGPICSPGLSALDAVTHPAATDYLYFLSGKDGKTYFAKTYEEHQQNIARHL